uniref:Uncharacterized protein n=1 Tax=viral metagenome TaxID=1070528 RepID=A0A6H1ZAE8_9ZZZZ
MSDNKAGKGGTKKYGRNKDKCAAYRSQKRGEKNKVVRVFRSNGLNAAKAYARKHGIEAFAEKRLGI